MTSIRYIGRGGVAAGLSALLLAACGGGGGTADKTNDSATVAQTGQMIPEDSAEARAKALLASMSLSQKIQLVHGVGYVNLEGTIYGHGYDMSHPGVPPGAAGSVAGIPELGIPSLHLVDAASGINAKNVNATSLPSTIALAASWDPALSERFGRRIGIEARALGFGESLGGAINLAFDPRSGRTFENMGEDPILAGEMLASRTIGVQAQQVISTVKHFAFNSYETNRYIGNSILDEQTMRETELLGFEIAVQKGKPGNVMCSFNLVNGTYACEHAQMLGWLKNEWGYKGIVQSDWGANNSTVASANAGLDEEQPSQTSGDRKLPEIIEFIVGKSYFVNDLMAAVGNGQVPMSRLDDMVLRKLRTMIKIGVMDNPPVPGGLIDEPSGNADALQAARESMVLLKNSAAAGDSAPVLPLSAQVKTIAVIGSHADRGVIAGGGSGGNPPIGENAVLTCPLSPDAIFPNCANWYASSPLEALRARYPDAAFHFYSGKDAAEAAAGAAKADVAIVFAHAWQNEGVDLKTLAIPSPAEDRLNAEYDHNALIDAVAGSAKRTVVVLQTGGPVLMPWIDRVHAVLEAWYPGVRGGQAIADILSGDVNPSGKLPVTFPKSDADLTMPLPTNVGSVIGQSVAPRGLMPTFEKILGRERLDQMRAVHFNQKLNVGYKHFDAVGKEPLFHFGHGLSYTTFAYGKASVSADGQQNVNVSFTLTNTGSRAGSEVAQVYAALPQGVPGLPQPPKRLVGWKKVALKPGESRVVTVQVPSKYLSVWDAERDRWHLHPGSYAFSVSASAAQRVETNPLTQRITLAGK